MNCNDCLIWIGSSYQTVNEYLKEAEARGCCRKVPSWPSWVKPGETRVFLSHRDGYKGSDRGSIFGYFVLQGVDIILTQADCDRYKALTAEHLKKPDGWIDAKTLKDRWTTACFEGPEPFIDFWNDTVVADRLPYKNPHRPATRPKKPKRPSQAYEDDVMDFILDFLIGCEPDGDGSGHGGYGVSTDQTGMESSRECGEDGLRIDPEKALKPGAWKKSGRKAHASLYFVDALTRWIDESFCELLKELIKAALTGETRQKAEGKRKKGTGKKPAVTEQEIRAAYVAELRGIAGRSKGPRSQEGLPEFQEVVKLAKKQERIWAEIPEPLQGFAETRGALVLFNKPYPFFYKAPKASFLGLLRIDGDDLMRQVGEINRRERETREIMLPYCESGEADEPKSKSALVVSLAQRLRINKAFAGKIMDEFAELIASELNEHDKIRLNNIGTLRIRAQGDRRLVKFKASGVLKGKVKKASGGEPARADQSGVAGKKVSRNR